MAVLYKDKTIYINKYVPNLFDNNKFIGRLFKVIVPLNNGEEIEVFYGIKTEDPFELNYTLPNEYIVDFSFKVLNEFYQIIPEIGNATPIVQKITVKKIYKLNIENNKFYINNISCTYPYYIDINSVSY